MTPEANVNQQNHPLLREQNLKTSLDISTGNSGGHYEPQAVEKRAWGPGTEVYYKDSWGVHKNLYSRESVQEVENVIELPSDTKLTRIKTFAQKTMQIIKSKLLGTADEKDILARSIGNKLGEIKQEAEKEYAKTKEPFTKNVIDLSDQLEKELQKETLNWNKIDLLIRQLSIWLVQKMAFNDHATIQAELNMMQNDVQNIRNTYNTKWELAIGIVIGAVAVIGGVAGIGSGITGSAGLKGIADGVGTIVQGAGQPAQKWIGSDAESKRQLHNYELERDRSYKQTVDSSLQGNKSSKGGQISQRDRAIEAAYRAFLQVASAG